MGSGGGAEAIVVEDQPASVGGDRIRRASDRRVAPRAVDRAVMCSLRLPQCPSCGEDLVAVGALRCAQLPRRRLQRLAPAEPVGYQSGMPNKRIIA